LAVQPGFQGQGIGSELLAACIEEARSLELERAFTLTYEQRFFERFGFAIVEKEELPHKVWTDCIKCPKRPACDEIAMLLKLERVGSLSG
jgi:amino-acid N-acetyltransferase